jgi:hypothetical protein
LFRHGTVSTEVDRRPFLFTVIAASVSTVAAVLLFALSGGNALAIFAGILVSVVALVAWFILFVMLTDHAYVEGNELRTHYLLKKASIPFEKIGRITCREKVYYVYDRQDELLGTINGQLTGIDGILRELEKNGVRFE